MLALITGVIKTNPGLDPPLTLTALTSSAETPRPPAALTRLALTESGS